MDWQAPKRPFDLEAFLRGDKRWIGDKSARRPVNGFTSRPRLEHSKSSSREPSKPEHDIRAEPRPADQVPDIPAESSKKTFRVPRAPPDVQFYRLKTKRPIHEGEVLSESDDDIDETWLHRRHADTIAALPGPTRAEKEFLQRYDTHLLIEAPASYAHTAEALVRFCRQHRAWLRRPDMQLELYKKASALRLQGRLSWKTIQECKETIEGKVEKDEDGGEPMDVDVPAAEAALPESPKSPTHQLFGRCATCDEAIDDMRAALRCSYPGCRRPEHHRRCVELDTCGPFWICDACTTEGITNEDLPAYVRRRSVARKSRWSEGLLAVPDSHDEEETGESARRRESGGRKARRDDLEHRARRDSQEQRVRRESTEQRARRESTEQRARRESLEHRARREAAEKQAQDHEQEAARNGMDVDKPEPARPDEPLDVHTIQSSLESEMRARATGMFPNLKRANRAL